MIISIPDSVIKESPEELLLEIAIYLYLKKIVTLSRASKIANMNLIAFQKQLAFRRIPIHFTEADLEKDLKNLSLL